VTDGYPVSEIVRVTGHVPAFVVSVVLKLSTSQAMKFVVVVIVKKA
jgi:hypothetical protein